MTQLSEVRKAVKPHLRVVGDTGRTDVPKLSVREAAEGVELSDRGRQLLVAKSTDGEDRSARLYELGALLTEAGAKPDSVFVLLRASSWNKFKGRDDEVERIWEAVHRAQDTQEQRDSVSSGYTVRTGEPELLGSFLSRSIAAPYWLVEGVLPAESVIYVVARAKAYKSTLVTDLALSLVGGVPFFNKFEVKETTSVLMVQEENPDSLQQVRMRAMCAAKSVGVGSIESDGNGGFVMDTTPLHLWNQSGLNLTSKRDRKRIERQVEKTKCKVLILDPLYIMCAGADITRPEVASSLAQWFNSLKAQYGITVVIVHHNKKMPEDPPEYVPELMYGSSYLWNGADGGIFLFAKHIDEDGRPKDVLAHRHYRAWQQPPFKFSIYLEEDGSEYIVQIKEREKASHPLVSLVEKSPGIMVKEVMEELNITKSAVSHGVKKYGLKLKPVKASGSKGGRPKVGIYPSELN